MDPITVKIKIIDGYTKRPRIKDTLVIRIGKPAFPMRNYIKVGQYITDSLGIVKVNLNRNERYSFTTLSGKNGFGDREFAEGKLKDGEEIIIEETPDDSESKITK